MRRQRWAQAALLTTGLAAGGLLVAMNQDASNGDVEVAEWQAAAVRIIRWGENPDGLAKFDSRTGAIWEFNSDPRNASVSPEWVEEVYGVGNGPVGTFRLEATDTPALFLVNVVTGETWVLRPRRNTEYAERYEQQYGQWQRVRDFSRTIRATGS